MPALPDILILAFLPALGSALGAGLAEWKRPTPAVTGSALHAAAGIASAGVAIELMPRALGGAERWALALAFLGGAFLSVLLRRATDRLRRNLGGSGAVPWPIYAAVGADLLVDGLTTGAGAAVSGSLGLLLAASQVAGNLPGGFAVTARLAQCGVSRTRRLAMAALYPVPALGGAAFGFAALRGAGEPVHAAALAALAGLLLLATAEDLLPEADAPGAPRWASSLSFAGGFVLLLLGTGYVAR